MNFGLFSLPLKAIGLFGLFMRIQMNGLAFDNITATRSAGDIV
jgi:hypothetical protein